MNQAQVLELSQKYILENYGRLPLVMARGEGSFLWDADGKRYIDCFAGFGAAGIAGHCHPRIVASICEQAKNLLCHGNYYTNQVQAELAQAIIERSFPGKVFFCHSGAEANEAALKLVRYAFKGERSKVICFENSFHGRTFGGLSLCPESFQLGFGPMLPGAQRLPFNDLAAVERAIDAQTGAVFVEPIQGEGGVNEPSVEFMRGLRELCSRVGALLVCDEVWTAPARTGAWFGFQHYGITPDVMTVAKAIGGGVPLGACVIAEQWTAVLKPGTHGCTMGGNPLCAAAGRETLALIAEQDLVARAHVLGEKVRTFFAGERIACLQELRGRGLMLGLKLDEAVVVRDVMLKCIEQGVLVCVGKNNVLRIAPALTIEEELLGQALGVIGAVLRSV